MQINPQKRCKRCGTEKPIDQFHRTKCQKDGHNDWCKQCWNAYCEQRRRAAGMKPRTFLPRKGRAYDVPDGTKFCPHCKVIKPLTEFYQDRTGRHHCSAWCSACYRADMEVRRRAKGIKPRLDNSNEKQCPCCGEVKLLADFPKDIRRARGVNTYCYPCYRAYARERAKKNGYNTRARLARKGKYRGGSKHQLASQIVTLAVALGVVTRQPCAVCGTTELVQGHHADYMKPLEVTWLCRLHHFHVHGKLLDLK